MSDHHDIGKHLKLYYGIYIALLCFTGITVFVSTFHLSVKAAIIVALIVASTKGYLVANFFMHLNTERKIIFLMLFITVILFVPLMSLPSWTNSDRIKTDPNQVGKLRYDYVP